MKYPKRDTDNLGKTAEHDLLQAGTEIKWFCKCSVPFPAKIQSSAKKEWAGKGQKAFNHIHLSKHKLSGWDIKTQSQLTKSRTWDKWNIIETLF